MPDELDDLRPQQPADLAAKASRGAVLGFLILGGLLGWIVWKRRK